MLRAVVVASTGGWDSASTRDRLGPLARDSPWPMNVISARPFPTDDQLEALLAAGDGADLLVLQRVMPVSEDMDRLRARYRHIIFDLDDAIYAVPPSVGRPSAARLGKEVGRLFMRGYPRASVRRKPLIKTLGAVDCCVVGNEILGKFAGRYCQQIVEIPTTVAPVDTVPDRPDSPQLVWVGLADNIQYLSLVAPALERLRDEFEFGFTVVSGRPWADSPIPTAFVPWSEEAEREALLTATVGLAPLTDDPWTRGKCARRSILYGGHALAAVASPVGVTDQIIVDGETGLLPRTGREWMEALQRLISDPSSADAMGRRAHERISARFSDDVALRMWHGLIARLTRA